MSESTLVIKRKIARSGKWVRPSVVLIFFILFFPSFAKASGSNCDAIESRVEQMICYDSDLTDQQEIVKRTLGEILSISSHKARVNASQIQWEKSVRGRCQDESCLAEKYEARIENLRQLWQKTWSSLKPVASRNDKPFQGIWEACALYRGYRICSNYLLLQKLDRVCGDFSYWASGQIYTLRLKARVGQYRKATTEDIRPRSHPDSLYEFEKNAEEKTVASDQKMIICSKQMYGEIQASDSSKCETLLQHPGYRYSPLTPDAREDLQSQPWISMCLNQG